MNDEVNYCGDWEDEDYEDYSHSTGDAGIMANYCGAKSPAQTIQNMADIRLRKKIIMRVSEVEYTELRVSGQYENNKLSVTVQLEDGDDEAEAVRRAKRFVSDSIMSTPARF